MQNAISGLRVIAVMLAAIFLLVLILKISAAIKRKKGVSFGVLILAAVALVATLGVMKMAESVEIRPSEEDVQVFAPNEFEDVQETQAQERAPSPRFLLTFSKQ